MFNTYFGVNAQFEQPLNEFKSVQNTRMVQDFYETDPKRGFYGGGAIDARFDRYPISFALTGLAARHGGLGRGLREDAVAPVHALDVLRNARHVAASRDQQHLNRSVAEGCLGPAVHACHLHDHPDDLKCAEFLAARASEIAQAAGAIKTWPERVLPQTLTVHLLGTCRMGNDAKASVIDRFHRTHDVPNLFICDGSSMVTSSRGQPTETISALAFRAGEHIAAFARRGEI